MDETIKGQPRHRITCQFLSFSASPLFGTGISQEIRLRSERWRLRLARYACSCNHWNYVLTEFERA